MSIWDEYTNLYPLSKTLRFELKPTKETQQLADVVRQDREIDRLYQQEMKPMLDNMHEKFIIESLSQVTFEARYLRELYDNYEKIRDYGKKYKDNMTSIQSIKKSNKVIEQALRKSVTNSFDSLGETWKQKYMLKTDFEGHEILIKACALDILKKINPQKIEEISKFDRFFTYFDGYNKNRENYYSKDEKATAVSHRVINVNLLRFFNCRKTFYFVLDKMPELSQYECLFEFEKYQEYLGQEGIEEFNLNVGEINKKINLFYQNNPKTFSRLPVLNTLYKQIGIGHSVADIFVINKNEEWARLKELIEKQNQKIIFAGNEMLTFEAIKLNYHNFFDNPGQYNLESIYLNKKSVNTISNAWFRGWETLADLLKIKINKNTGDYKMADVSLADLKNSLEGENGENILSTLFKTGKDDEYIKLFAENGWKTFLNIWKYEIDKNFVELDGLVSMLSEKTKNEFDANMDKEFVKRICDNLLSIEQMAKYHVVGEGIEVDSAYYDVIDKYLENSVLLPYYNGFRNYLTKRPYNDKKIKLNFEKGTLFNGWSANDVNEFQYGSVMLKMRDRLYVGVLRKNGLFSKTRNPNAYSNVGDAYLMTSKLLKSTMIYGSLYLGKYNSTYKEDQKTYSPNEMIVRVKEILKGKSNIFSELKSIVDFDFNDDKELARKLSEHDFYAVSFEKIDENYVRNCCLNGDLYLFEILNKDIVGKSRTDNLHTKYFKELFSEKNLEKGVLKIDGYASIYFREKTENLPKKDKYPGIIEGKRFSVDKYLFHLPIKINYNKTDVYAVEFNKKVRDLLISSNSKMKFIGIDRGEKNLLYFSVIDSLGNIIEQGSLNNIICGNKAVDYNFELSKRAQDMMEARKNWDTIGNIKNFKEGYLSQAIFQIYSLIIKHDAIIILEDLNSEFKAKRLAKVEKSIYKKFELALAKKLEYLVLKDRDSKNTPTEQAP